MKRLFLFAAIMLAVSCSSGIHRLDKWTMHREGSEEYYHVNVPCTVAGALNEAGALGPDVLDQTRYLVIDKSQFDSPWIFTTTFSVKPGLRHILRFNSLGYRADISLNGTTLASADTTFGVFLVRDFDITDLARRKNTLEVRLHRAQAGDLNMGFVDWNPRPVDESMGILGNVELISTPDVQVASVLVKPELDPDQLSRADILVTATLINRSDHAVSGFLKGEYEGGSFSEPVSLAAGESRKVTVREQIDNPRIWWSHEMGTPEMYTLTVDFETGGNMSHSVSTSFGIRDIRSEVDAAGHRQFYLNGKPFLVKAGGWTDDIFLQDTPERTRRQVEFVRDMGLNCIRFENIWGKDDSVYEICDRLGILALVGWSCQWEWKIYCGLPETPGVGCINTPETEDLAVRYFHDQLIRLYNHPSIIGWLTGSDFIPNPRLEARYMELYDEMEYRPYICSAKGLASEYGGPSGMKMLGPYEYVGPDYWYLENQNGGAYGFNTETGIGMNIPQLESVRRMVGIDHLWPLDANWNYHCTSSTTDMNSTRVALETTTGLYGAPAGFRDFIRKAHALDYDGTRAMFESFRCHVPRATGIVQWMLNSAWPSLYWQLYDWYMVPTAGYFGTKKACQPVQLVFNYGDRCIWAVNDVLPEAEYTAVLRIYGADSRLLRQEEKAIHVRPREPQKVFDAIKGACFADLELRNAAGETIADNFYCVPATQNEYLWSKSDWYITPIGKYSDLSFVTSLPVASVEMQSEPVEGGFDVLLVNASDTIAYQVILKAVDDSGELLPGVLWSDNFLSLVPGERKVVRCQIPAGTPAVSISLDGWNIQKK